MSTSSKYESESEWRSERIFRAEKVEITASALGFSLAFSAHTINTRTHSNSDTLLRGLCASRSFVFCGQHCRCFQGILPLCQTKMYNVAAAAEEIKRKRTQITCLCFYHWGRRATKWTRNELFFIACASGDDARELHSFKLLCLWVTRRRLRQTAETQCWLGNFAL